ncbi:unnamed protein product [Alopecurus aequalis]
MSNMFDHGHGHAGHGGGEQGQQGDTLLCYLHPRELLVGVCAQCLRERLLLLLASKSSDVRARPYCRALRRRTGSIVSVFALGSSFIHRLDSSRHHGHDVVVDGGRDDDKTNPDDDASIASLDDSFISIKFEDNGKATWVDTQNQEAVKKIAEEGTGAATALRPAATTAVVEHVKRGGAARWRKQVVGRLLQLARWKRTSTSGKQASSSSAACPVADHQRPKGRGGRSWIRSLTRRHTAHGDRAWS